MCANSEFKTINPNAIKAVIHMVYDHQVSAFVIHQNRMLAK